MLGTRLIRKLSQDATVFVSYHSHVCKVKLNKPKALNALDIPMIATLQEHVNNWNNDPNIRVVLFSSEGQKAFCAGGDIKSLYEAKKEERNDVLSDFFWHEYILDYSLFRMKPTQICMYTGIVMGGGVGISIHAPFRIATESSVFSMPETAIGLYPDVGGSYFLPRLPGSVGLYLAITAGRVSGKELVQAGIATHFVSDEKIKDLTKAIIKDTKPESSMQDIEDTINSFADKMDGPLPDIDKIQKYFDGVESVEEIFERLKDDSEWANNKLQRSEKLCPLSMKVAFEQYKRGKKLTLKEAFAMEYRISMNFMRGDDFFEGYRAILLDKDRNPKWTHKSLEEVPDDLVQSYFEAPSVIFVDLDVDHQFKS